MIEEKLELVFITYNRASLLDNTLKQFLNSPFKDCKINVIDNCSSDNTPQICEKYQKLFSNFHLIRNKCNIGVNANIVEAYRSSSSKYTWLLGDDDDFDFSETEDVIEAVLSEKYDVIYVCSSTSQYKKIKGGTKTFKELLYEHNKNYDENIISNREVSTLKAIDISEGAYIVDLGFISAIILKTEHYDSDTIIKAYDNVPALFPHFAFITKSIDENFSVYKSKKDLIIQKSQGSDSDPEHAWGLTRFYWAWTTSSLMIKDKRIRDISFKSLSFHPVLPTFNYILCMTAGVIIDKRFDKKDRKEYFIPLISNIFRLCGKNIFKSLFISLLLMLTYLIPQTVCYKIHETFRNRYNENHEN